MIKIKQQPMPLQQPRNIDAKAIDDKIKSAAKMYEKHFLNEMVKAMRSTVSHGGLIQRNMAEKIFSEKLDGEYVDSWGDRGGIGLGELIHQQVMERFGLQLGLRKNELAQPKGPVKLNSSAMHEMPVAGNQAKGLNYTFANTVNEVGKSEVLAPWTGILIDAKNLEGNQTYLKLSHDQGLTSELIFKGNALGQKIGAKVEAGARVGLLDPTGKNLYWRLRGDESSEVQR